MDITQIVSLIISLLIAVLTICIIPIIRNRYGQEVITSTLANAEIVMYWINVFVKAAEQLYTKEKTEEKKNYVLSLMSEKMKDLNITMDVATINAAIESAVLELHQSLKDPAQTTTTQA